MNNKTLIISDGDIISDKLVKTFLDNQSAVEILTTKTFLNKTSLAGKPDNIIAPFFITKTISMKSYREAKELLRSLLNISSSLKIKVLYLFPYSIENRHFDNFKKLTSKIIRNKKAVSKIIYLGEILETSVTQQSIGPLNYLVGSWQFDKTLPLATKEFFAFPVRVDEVVAEIIRQLYSFGYSGSQKAIISNPISIKLLVSELRSKYPESKQTKHTHEDSFNTVENPQKIILWTTYKEVLVRLIEINKTIFNNNNKRRSFRELLFASWYHFNAVKKNPRSQNLIWSRLGKLVVANINKIGAILLLILVGLPYLLGLSVLSYLSVTKGNITIANNLLDTVSLVGYKTSEAYQNMPLVGHFYRSAYKVNLLLSYTLEIKKSFTDVKKQTKTLLENLFDTKVNDAEDEGGIGVGLETIYRNLSLIEGELSTTDILLLKNVIRNSLSRELELKEKLIPLATIGNNLDNLFGKDAEKKYLIVLLDNSKKMPSGGKIIGLFTVNFKASNLVDYKYYDPDEISKRIKGDVEPPFLISKYIEKKWGIANSNWDFRFHQSAEKTGWFMTKATGETFAGVIYVDSTSILTLANSYSSTKKNTYTFKDITSPEILKDMFRDVMRTLVTSKISDKVKTSKEFENILDIGGIRILISDNLIKQELARLDWDDSIKKIICADNCYSDFLSVNEVNLSDSSSLEIDRSVETTIDVQEKVIKKKIKVTLTNKGDKEFRGFISVVTNSNTGFSKVKIFSNGVIKEMEPEAQFLDDYQSGGVLVNVLPKKDTTIEYATETSGEVTLTRSGNYGLVYKKQSGLPDYNLTVRYVTLPELTYSADSRFVLTNDGQYEYNTNLLKDIGINFSWKI